MPSLEQITVETRALGLPDSDADQLYDYLLRKGHRVGDYKATVRCWHRIKGFPSQKKFKTFERLRNEARDEEMREAMKRMRSKDRERSE
jgi:hypothetical protein